MNKQDYINKALELEMKWISVNDRLPPKDGDFLAFSHRECVVVWGLGGGSSYKSGGSYYDISEITHWMPLPEPPEKQK